MTELSATEERLYNKLRTRRDVPIRVLYRAMRRTWPHDGLDTRRQQQALGWAISRINVKLRGIGLRVQPGRARGTYRLSRLNGSES